MVKLITESEVEQAALDILSAQGYGIVYGPDIAFDGPNPERQSYADVVLIGRLRDAIDRINPKIPADGKEEAVKKLLRVESPDLIINNKRFHAMLVNGVDVEYRRDDRVVADKVWLFDFSHPSKNEFLAVNQFTIIENNHNRRPDIILFVNGLPLVVIELKNPADENATVHSAFKQFQTYKFQIPSLFNFAEVLIASDGFDAKAGTITSDWEPTVTRSPFGEYAEGVSYCGIKSCVIYDGVLKYDFDKLAFYLWFRTLEYVSGPVCQLQKEHSRRVIFRVCFLKVIQLGLDIGLFGTKFQ